MPSPKSIYDQYSKKVSKDIAVPVSPSAPPAASAASVPAHYGGIDVDAQCPCGIDAAEVLEGYSRLQSDLDSEHSDGFASEVHFDGEAVGGAREVRGLDGDYASEALCDLNIEHRVTAVSAISGRPDQRLRQVVHSHVQNDLVDYVGLP